MRELQAAAQAARAAQAAPLEAAQLQLTLLETQGELRELRQLVLSLTRALLLERRKATRRSGRLPWCLGGSGGGGVFEPDEEEEEAAALELGLAGRGRSPARQLGARTPPREKETPSRRVRRTGAWSPD